MPKYKSKSAQAKNPNGLMSGYLQALRGGGRLNASQKKQAAFASPRMFKKGGTVKKTGMALVHKGEKVLTAAQKKKMMKGFGRNYS